MRFGPIWVSYRPYHVNVYKDLTIDRYEKISTHAGTSSYRCPCKQPLTFANFLLIVSISKRLLLGAVYMETDMNSYRHELIFFIPVYSLIFINVYMIRAIWNSYRSESHTCLADRYEISYRYEILHVNRMTRYEINFHLL